ncbi:DUF4372 domain-containing protein [Desulfoluna spongiiphila]|uniref:DUF4372 domain-containing protein n=1 Tax=Desulfoluna spongiiphila TaxID=419481 RepID=UPI000B894FA7|nr:DUF4372 domain-containing protein [Desulfoluna spongiiphila]
MQTKTSPNKEHANGTSFQPFQSNSRFFDRNEFARLVSVHGAERNSKGFKCWDHFVSMLFCQIAQAKSLREIFGGLASANGKLRYLGMKQSQSKSKLSYANQKRPWEMYRSLFYQTLNKCQSLAPTRHKFRFKNKL